MVAVVTVAAVVGIVVDDDDVGFVVDGVVLLLLLLMFMLLLSFSYSVVVLRSLAYIRPFLLDLLVPDPSHAISSSFNTPSQRSLCISPLFLLPKRCECSPRIP